ncbi:ATP synthase subunit gamma, mitochondrial-like [Haliotis rufescens]|uniref:ATP synthase subunit gamma, mitochondrial-like n=1 Tax=Haliotis rufescens TaxID=6454 RepID=UPI00201EAFDD|nr:ATP synthase subunit gamma, mitochondrial-like [Haliotis rufescens]
MEAMLSRTVQVISPQCTQVRGMATLKDIRIRLKSVTNIQKITKSMKMVSAAKFSRAERELRPARPYGLGAKAFYEKAEVEQDENQPNHLIVAVTSDRGLCGGIHSNVVKHIRSTLGAQKPGIDTKIVCIGDKSKAMLQRQYPKNILMSFNDIGKRPPVFADATLIASAMLESGYKYDHGTMIFNIFKSVVSYRTTEQPLFSLDSVNGAEKLNLYDSLDEDVVRSYNEFALVSLLYYALKEASCSEQSSRMTAMDAASKNAGEMIDKLTLTFNRTRQAVITRELIEIISGASAL